jgi:general control protein GCN4
MTQGNYLLTAISCSSTAVNTRFSDQMKLAEPDMWSEDMWSTTPELSIGSEFSPLMGTDLSGTTVSPSEVTMNPTMPTPTFSSPYFFDSPSEGYDTSPLFSADDITGGDNWYSLFPEANQDSEDNSSAAAAAASASLHQAMIGEIIVKQSDSRESTTSPETSPKFTGSTRMQKRSSTSGVRKRQQPLPPIVVEDPSDIVALKRARNTLAARKSRAKKAEKMDEMEATIQELKAEVEHWKSIALSKGL